MMDKFKTGPAHLKKFGNSSYEQKLRSILINEKHLDEEFVNKERNNYIYSTQPGYRTNAAFPNTVNIELINKCNYKCAMCYTVNHEGAGISINFEDFKKIIDECKENNLLSLFIANGSEPLIFKDFRKYIEYAATKIPDIAVFTNALKLNQDTADFLIESGVTRINISLDAATKETYKKIRGGDLEFIENNIEYLLKQKTKLSRPLVRVSFCVQEENLHEIDLFKQKWEGRVDSVEFQSLHKFDSLDNIKEINNLSGVTLNSSENFCASPFGYIAIWSNGDISPCCSFFGQKLVLGNIKLSTIGESWRSALSKKIRDGFNNQKTCGVCEECLTHTVDLQKI